MSTVVCIGSQAKLVSSEDRYYQQHKNEALAYKQECAYIQNVKHDRKLCDQYHKRHICSQGRGNMEVTATTNSDQL